MDLQQLRQFLRPNFSFKAGALTRGSKGVGATYLGYGFNYLQVSTKINKTQNYSGLIENGRSWVDDKTGTVARPKIVPCQSDNLLFNSLDRGTSIAVQLKGNNIRPANLSWNQATKADQWLALLRILTSAGGIYVDGSPVPNVHLKVFVKDKNGKTSEASINAPKYLYPNELITRSANLDEFIKDQNKIIKKGGDPAKISPKFKMLTGIYGQWTGPELLKEVDSDCPINLSLDAGERQLAKDAGISVYVFLAFSTELWDTINDNSLGLRKGGRALHGGLQLATRHMPQGMTLTIPMTNNIGFQNLAHVIVHFEHAEPDLGRKGFQPEYVHLAEKISVSAVTAFRRRYFLLRKPGSAKIFNDEVKIDQWIKAQEAHEKAHALVVTGSGLFLPTEELPIRSEPLVEQDVVALFNQMLSSGLVRGIQLIASSQYHQYDGLYRVMMSPPFTKFIRSKENPLGVEAEHFDGKVEPQVTKVKVLEYKFTMDGLVEELQAGVKDVNDIGLLIAWELGDKWKQMFDITCYLDEDVVHHRQVHGTTHSFVHSISGTHAFEAIILRDLVGYLTDPDAEILHQRSISEA